MVYTPPKMGRFVIRKLFSLSHAAFSLISLYEYELGKQVKSPGATITNQEDLSQAFESDF